MILNHKKSANVRKWNVGKIPKLFENIGQHILSIKDKSIKSLDSLFNKIGQWDFSFEVQKATFYLAAMAIGYYERKISALLRKSSFDGNLSLHFETGTLPFNNPY